jgi:two-component system response regulator MprA
MLIVDDDPDVRRMLRRLFEPDYEVSEAEDGVAAWDIYPRYRPAFLVTDIQMPRLDGLSLCRILRARGFRQLRIIVYTSQSISIAEARSAGADELVLKTEPLAHLRELVKKLHARTAEVNSGGPLGPEPR